MGEWHGRCVLAAFNSMRSSGGALELVGRERHRQEEFGEKKPPEHGPTCHLLWVKVSSGSVPGRRAPRPSAPSSYTHKHSHTLKDGAKLGGQKAHGRSV